MKIKYDFVTNSSSASFIIHFSSKDKKIDDNFLEKISGMESDEKIYFLNHLQRNEDGTFTAEDFTPMFNFWDQDSLSPSFIRLYMFLTLDKDNSNYKLISANLNRNE